MPVNQVTFMNNYPGKIDQIKNLPVNQGESNASKPTTGFGSFLKNAIEEVNAVQNESDVLTGKLARGENVELHDVMITAQKASITLQAALEVRNKAVEAYQEIMRMQV